MLRHLCYIWVELFTVYEIMVSYLLPSVITNAGGSVSLLNNNRVTS